RTARGGSRTPSARSSGCTRSYGRISARKPSWRTGRLPMVELPVEKSERTPIAFRGGGFDPIPRTWVSWVFFAGAIAVWQAASNARLIDPLFLPSPAEIARALYNLAISGELTRHFAASLLRIGAGWVLGAATGVVAGGLIGLFWLWRSAGLPFISALFPIPKIALLPLLILWLGIGETSKVATIALGVFFPMAISAYAGVDSVPRNLIRMAQSFNVPFSGIVTKVILPGMLPSILAGCRISASIALILVVAAEMI